MRISDWSSDVCSSDLLGRLRIDFLQRHADHAATHPAGFLELLDRAHRQVDRGREAHAHVAAGGAEDLRVDADPLAVDVRSEERRVGKECGSPCKSRGSPSPSKKKNKTKTKYEQ